MTANVKLVYLLLTLLIPSNLLCLQRVNTVAFQVFNDAGLFLERKKIHVIEATGDYSILDAKSLVIKRKHLNKSKCGNFYSRLYIHRGKKYVLSSEGKVIIYNKDGFEKEITLLTNKRINTCFMKESRVYFLAEDGLYCYNLDKKNMVIYQKKLLFGSINHFLINNSNLVITTEMGIVFCIHMKNGSLLWWKSITSAIFTKPVIYNNFVYINTEKGIFSLDLENGFQKNFIEENVDPFISGIIMNSSIIFYSTDEKVIIYDLKTGKIHDKKYILFRPVTDFCVYKNGFLFVGREGKLVYVDNDFSCRILADLGTTTTIKPHVEDGNIFVFSDDGQLFLVNTDIKRISESHFVNKAIYDIDDDIKIVIENGTIIFTKNNKILYLWRDPDIYEFDIINVMIKDLNKDRKKDFALLLNESDLLHYERILLFINKGNHFDAYQFQTVGADDLSNVLKDFRNDGVYELILNKEIGEIYTLNLKYRIIWTDVYDFINGKYIWASINYPSLYENDIIPKYESKKKKHVYKKQWMQGLYRSYCRQIIEMGWRLITLKKQMETDKVKLKTYSGDYKTGLTRWYYNEIGIRALRMRWDNLALFAFNVAISIAPKFSAAYYQMGQIYLTYGLNSYAVEANLYALNKGKNKFLFYCQDQYSKLMLEEKNPVLTTPKVTDIKIALAESYFNDLRFIDSYELCNKLLKYSLSKNKQKKIKGILGKIKDVLPLGRDFEKNSAN